MNKVYMKYVSVIMVLFFGLILLNCSGTKEVGKTKSKDAFEIPGGNIRASMVNLQISKLYAWLNLMPGTAKQTFNITGDLTVLPGSVYDFQTLKLKRIKISQKGAFLYFIKPTVRQSGTGKKGDLKKILFSTIKGVEIIPFHKINENITVEFIFDNKGKSLSYIVPDIKVEKTY